MRTRMTAKYTLNVCKNATKKPLLLRMSKKSSNFDLLPHTWGPLRKYSRVLPDIYHRGHFLPSLTAFPVAQVYKPFLCEHRRLIAPIQQIKFHFIRQKIPERLHMCNFCCTFADKIEKIQRNEKNNYIDSVDSLFLPECIGRDDGEGASVLGGRECGA